MQLRQTALLAVSLHVLGIFSFPTPLLAAELRPLREVLAQEASDAMVSFTLQRCAAVYLAVAVQFEIDGGADYKDYTDAFRLQSQAFVEAAADVTQGGETQVAANVAGMVPLYREDMRTNYFSTGNRLEGVVADDMKLCKQISGR